MTHMTLPMVRGLHLRTHHTPPTPPHTPSPAHHTCHHTRTPATHTPALAGPPLPLQTRACHLYLAACTHFLLVVPHLFFTVTCLSQLSCTAHLCRLPALPVVTHWRQNRAPRPPLRVPTPFLLLLLPALPAFISGAGLLNAFKDSYDTGWYISAVEFVAPFG